MDPQKFTLTDADGASHEYLLLLHGGVEGRAVVFRLLALLGPGAGELLKGLLGPGGIVQTMARDLLAGEQTAGEALKGLLDQDASALAEMLPSLAAIDFGAVGSRLGLSMDAVAADPRLVDELVKHATRDNRALSKATEFDRAFQGNYGEMLALLWQIIRRNRFFPVPSTR